MNHLLLTDTNKQEDQGSEVEAAAYFCATDQSPSELSVSLLTLCGNRRKNPSVFKELIVVAQIST